MHLNIHDVQYPEEFARGIISESYMAGDMPDASLFKEFKPNEEKPRNDGFWEISINWLDEVAALQLLLNLENSKGEKTYKSGAAVFSTEALETLCRKSPTYKGYVDYERHKIPGNEYHGNILMKEEYMLTKEKKKQRDMFASAIIVSCYKFIRT